MKVTRRRIRFDGACSDWIYFSTPSWTRGSRIRHDIRVCKRTGTITCTCESLTYRGRYLKHGNILELDTGNGCKHVRAVMETFQRILKENIECAISA